MLWDQLLGLAGIAAVYALGVGCAIHALMTKTREATSAIAWILVCLTLPLLGAFFYLTIGQDRLLRRRTFHASVASADYRARSAERRAEVIARHGRHTEEGRRFIADVRALTGAPLIGGNAIDLHVGGEEAYPAMLDAIGAARESLTLQMYTVDADEIGWRFAGALRDKAREGLEVKLLYDAVGCYRTDDDFWDRLRASGVEVAPFMPMRPLRGRWQVNLRNHRKLLVVDDQTAFTGSMNIGSRHLTSSGGSSRDLSLRIRGPAVPLLQEVFDRGWYLARGEQLGPRAVRAGVEGEEALQVIESGPDEPEGTLWHALLAVVHHAERSITVVTPYFVPHSSLLDALEIAARRGVTVRVVIPRKGDSILINLATRNYIQPILVAGGRVYEYLGAMLHMKILLVDGELTIIGSSNMDNRSHFLNFELDLAIHGPPFAQRMEALIEKELASCDEISVLRELQASALDRVSTRLASLFSPIL